MKRTFTVADVERLLLASGAKKPWSNPAHLQSVADFLTADGGVLADKRDPICEAHSSAAKLLRALMAILPTEDLRVADDNPRRCYVDDVRRLFPNDVRRLWQLVETLCKYFPPDRGPPGVLVRSYADFARPLLLCYQWITGSGKAHENSPAMRFIAAALTEAGYSGTGQRPLTPGGVAAAIEQQKSAMSLEEGRSNAMWGLPLAARDAQDRGTNRQAELSIMT